jgi:acetyl esterase/lipase
MKLIITTAILFCSFLLSAQTRDTLYLWPNDVPNETGTKHQSVQTDNTKDDVIRLTDVTNPCLVVFEPETPNNTGGSIIICPGGGYNILAIDKEGYEVALWLNKLGYTAFVLQYRVPNNQDGALNDIQRAIRLVRSKADKYHLQSEKIGVMGFSAGGSLCARAFTQFRNASYAKTDSIDQYSCRPNFSMLIYPAYLDKGENRSLSPELAIGDFTPPCFIFGTADDKYGNSSLVMAGALRDHKIPVELHITNEGGHGYGLRPGNHAAEAWPTLAESWMEKVINTTMLNNYQRTLNFPKTNTFPQKSTKKKDVWVFMMAGQSNMAGRGFVEPQDTIPSERILTINKNKDIILAKEPLNINEPWMKGLDCGVAFASQLLKQIPDNVSILLIPTAVGGTSLNQWLGDSTCREVQLLSNFHEKIDRAKKQGEIKGILWHQGESDANKNGILHYKENLTLLFNEFREYAGNKSLPIFIGELGTYRNSTMWMKINNEIKKYTLTDDNSYLIGTSDLTQRGDMLHFDAKSQRTLGKRFANEYIKNIK